MVEMGMCERESSSWFIRTFFGIVSALLVGVSSSSARVESEDEYWELLRSSPAAGSFTIPPLHPHTCSGGAFSSVHDVAEGNAGNSGCSSSQWS